MKKVLILNASHNDERMIRALKELNFYVISTGNAPDLPGHKLCDEYIPADYSDKDKILEIAKELHIDRICACCNDFGVITAAYVAEKLGLPGYDSYEKTLILHNKDKFKEFAGQNDILTPQAVGFTDREAAYAFADSAEYPIMVKATDLSAGNGIRRADNLTEALDAIDNAFQCSRNKRIVIEPYIQGNQHGFCTFLMNKRVAAYCSNNEYSMVNPYRVEIDTFPATDEELVADVIIGQIEKMAELLDLCDGIFHLQYITDANGIPHIIECMRRIPGGLYTIPAESVSGINWDYWEVRAKCTDSLSDFPYINHVNRGYFSYRCLMGKTNGKIKSVRLAEDVVRHRYDSWQLIGVNDMIEKYQSTPVGFIFTSFESQEEMLRTMIDNYSDSEVIVE